MVPARALCLPSIDFQLQPPLGLLLCGVAKPQADADAAMLLVDRALTFSVYGDAGGAGSAHDGLLSQGRSSHHGRAYAGEPRPSTIIRRGAGVGHVVIQ